MADTLTAFYEFVKPEITGSPDTWGNKWNANLDLFDTMFHTMNLNIGAALPLAGGTMTGPIHYAGADAGGNQLVTHDQVVAIVAGYLPRGIISIWAGGIGDIPANWRLCDGGGGTPDFRDRFIIGAGGTTGAGTTGGLASSTPTITVAGHILTLSEIPSHGHSTTELPHGHGTTENPHTHTSPVSNAANQSGFNNTSPLAGGPNSVTTSGAVTGLTVNANVTGLTVNNSGGGLSHTHTATSSAVPIMPPYYCLAYIMRV